MTRRLLTNMALAGVIAVAVLIAGMWLVAIARGYARLAFQPIEGNHGPWAHLYPLAEIYDYTLLCSICVLPISWIGLIVERTRRSAFVAILAIIVLFINLAQIPLID